ncbi:MAG TPA: molybdenum cofactor guanylyltransferase [Flavobacteriia bacterium]|nr:molybdenum cofactor guanylyltransferase [Flavobacteriia bacterium]
MKKHQKHTNLTKRENGNFAPNEIALVGTKCATIHEIVQKISKSLQNNYKTAYFDASHKFDKKPPLIDNYTFNKNGFFEETLQKSDNPYNLKITFNPYDLVFINGNHFPASQQILVLDAEKEASVKKRLEQLNNIQFIITTDENVALFDFLVAAYPAINNLKKYHIKEMEKITLHIKNLIEQQVPRVNGLILIGGKSTRMGTDKSNIIYHNKPQKDFLFDLLKDSFGQKNTYFSVRNKQQLDVENAIADTFLNLGPFGGICSAFQKNPNVAWLSIATDLPFVDANVINSLLKHRNPSKIATAFKGKSKNFPEPLITIWEPKAYPILLQYLAQGYSCPRKVLINNDVEIVEIDDKFIQNINTKEELDHLQF